MTHFTDHVRSTREGNVFSRVCDSVYWGSGPYPMMHWDKQEGGSTFPAGRIILEGRPQEGPARKEAPY